jgi:hypothetical protein
MTALKVGVWELQKTQVPADSCQQKLLYILAHGNVTGVQAAAGHSHGAVSCCAVLWCVVGRAGMADGHAQHAAGEQWGNLHHALLAAAGYGPHCCTSSQCLQVEQQGMGEFEGRGEGVNGVVGGGEGEKGEQRRDTSSAPHWWCICSR